MNCKTSGCSEEHWIERGFSSSHAAIHLGHGIAEVININNGGYDCCPLYKGKEKYGHTTNKVEWFLKMLFIWNDRYPFDDISTISMPNCQPDINCIKLIESKGCENDCCFLKEFDFSA